MKNSRIQNSSKSRLPAENHEVNSTKERRKTENEKDVISDNPHLDNSNQSNEERTRCVKTHGRANYRKENTNFNKKSISSTSHSNNHLPDVDSADYWAREINIDSQNIVKEESTAAVSGDSATRPSRSQNIRAAPTLFKASTNETSSPSISMKYNGSQSRASHTGKIPAKSESRNQVANKSVDTSSSVFRDEIDDDRLMKRSLVLHNIPEISDERRDQLGQAYLSLLHGGGGSALRWVSPSTCVIVFCSENLCQRGIDRSMRKPETAEFPPKLLSSIPELCSNDMLKVARELYNNIPPAQRDTRVANRMITAALGIRMPRTATSSSASKPTSSDCRKDNSISNSGKDENDNSAPSNRKSTCGKKEISNDPSSVFQFDSSHKEPVSNNNS